MDAKDCRHILRRRKALTRPHIAVGDVTANLGGDLIVERQRAVPAQLDILHSNRQSITIMWEGPTALKDRPAAGTFPPEAVIREARQRRRRRWLVAVLIVAAFVLVGTAAGLVANSGGKVPAPISPSTPKAIPPSVRPNHSVLPGTTQLVWIASGGLHLGNPIQGTDRVIAEVDATAARLVAIGSRVYFFRRGGPDISTANGGNRIAVLDIGSGRVHSLGAGINLTTTTDGRDLLVALDPFHLVTLSPTGARLSPVWTVPSGYTLNTYASQHPLAAVAGGIAIESTHPSPTSGAYVLAIWYPSRGTIRVLGHDAFVIGSYTRPGANHSVLAWIDGNGAGADFNRLAITDTATMTTRLVSSPLSGVFSLPVQQYGSNVAEFGSNFLGGGAFSPDGRQLAAFVSAFRPHDWPNAQLVLVNPNTGSVQLIANTLIQIGEPAGWATWSPTGSDLFGGSYREGPVIQAFALKTGETQATPLTFDVNAADDVTGSAVSVQVSGR
jgi:hypothetical protein